MAKVTIHDVISLFINLRLFSLISSILKSRIQTNRESISSTRRRIDQHEDLRRHYHRLFINSFSPILSSPHPVNRCGDNIFAKVWNFSAVWFFLQSIRELLFYSVVQYLPCQTTTIKFVMGIHCSRVQHCCDTPSFCYFLVFHVAMILHQCSGWPFFFVFFSSVQVHSDLSLE